MNERELLDKLAKIEALHSGTNHAGERAAASEARDRLRERLRAMQPVDPPIEMQFSIQDTWSRQLFLAMLRRYEVKPYRLRGQRSQTIMARVPRRFVDETLWPQFEAADDILRTHLGEVATRVIRTAIGDPDDEPEVAGGRLPGG